MITKTKLKDFDLIIVERKNIIIELINYGATIYSLKTPDSTGVFEDIVLQYTNPDDYVNNNIYLNSTTGPIAGRIKDGKLNIDNKSYQFNKNDHGNTLHSGDLALSYKIFAFKSKEGIDYDEVIFSYNENQMINYSLIVKYKIYDNQIVIDYFVKADNDFIFSITNHGYFNLSGDFKSNIFNHLVKLNSNLRHMIDENLVSTNQVVEETGIYDFTDFKKVGPSVLELKNNPKKGIDDVFFFPNNELKIPMAIVEEPISGRCMKVYSSMDHLVFYTHNNINNLKLKHIGKHEPHYALCFEAQKAPYGFTDQRMKEIITKKEQNFHEEIILEFYLS